MKEKLLQKIYIRKHSFVQWKLPPTALSVLWNDLHIAPAGFTKKLDWFITSDWTEGPAYTKKATVVHDLVFKKYPETVHPKILSTQQKRLKWVTKESDIIFADSKSTSSDLEKYYSVKPERITLNYPGLTVSNSSLDKDDIQAVLDKYKITPPFILSVGKIEPRKNIERLIKAYNSLLAEQNLPELVIVGMEGWDSKIEQSENIKYIGYVSDKELTALYKSAVCFVMPSIYEGFGYPVLEAMAHGCPVALQYIVACRTCTRRCCTYV
jgi:glycosyltransferase involved in cell wall biosynthesis